MRNGIDESLNLLKDLEAKLRTQRNDTLQNDFHQHLRTEPKNQKINNKQWDDKVITAYEQSSRSLQEQNLKLKKHVNRLIKLNDYLKNQLVMGNKYRSHFKDQPQTGLLQLETQYLREMNREKQLDVQLRNVQQSTKKSSIITPLTAQFETNRQSRMSANCHNNSKTGKLNTSRKPSEAQTLRKSTMMKSKKNNCPLCYH